MDDVTVASSLEIAQEEEYGVRERRFQHGNFHLGIHPFSLFADFTRFVAGVLLVLLLQELVAKLQCGGKVSSH